MRQIADLCGLCTMLTMLGAIAGDIIGSRIEGELGPPRDFALFHPDCRFTEICVRFCRDSRPPSSQRDNFSSLRVAGPLKAQRLGAPFALVCVSDIQSSCGLGGTAGGVRRVSVGCGQFE